MDKNRVKGAVNDAAGRLKRQAGEWTGDTRAQVEGSAQQLKGKAQKAWGTAKDAVRSASGNADRAPQTGMEHESEQEREAERKEEPVRTHSGPNR